MKDELVMLERQLAQGHGKMVMLPVTAGFLRHAIAIIRAAQNHLQTHGHTPDSAVDDALIDAGLIAPEFSGWRKKEIAKEKK